MACHRQPVPGGASFVCTRGRSLGPCQVKGCKRRQVSLCDWKVGEGKTCDAALCGEHARRVGKNKDLCPQHAEEWRTHPKNPKRVVP